MRAGKPRGPTLVSIFMHAFIVARVSHVRDKAAAPGLTFPIMTKGGGICARTDQSGKSGDLLPLFYLGVPTSAYRKAAPTL